MIIEQMKTIVEQISAMELEEKINCLNTIKTMLHEVSPFKTEPVDCVIWVNNQIITSNDYNPNSVAPKEMELLECSILNDGYTQPIVAWSRDNIYEVVDGFHRNRVGKESEQVNQRIHGYLPIVSINDSRQDLGDRMASTVRHNRARGKHKVDSMSDIVLELKKRNWSDEKIGKNLGMDADEVLRLAQITGLAELFSDREFSEAWEVDFEESDSLENQENISSY